MATFLQGKCLETIAHHLEGSSQKTNHSLCFVGFRNAYYLIIQSYFQRKGGESQVHPRKGHKSLEMWHICNSNLSFISALGGVGGKHHPPAALHPGKTRYPFYRITRYVMMIKLKRNTWGTWPTWGKEKFILVFGRET